VSEDNKIFPLGSYFFDTENRCLIFKEKTTQLSRREAQILYVLYENRGKVVKRSILLQQFWGSEDDPYHTRSLDVFITKLRSCLKDDKSIKISTLRGEGLRMDF